MLSGVVFRATSGGSPDGAVPRLTGEVWGDLPFASPGGRRPAQRRGRFLTRQARRGGTDPSFLSLSLSPLLSLSGRLSPSRTLSRAAWRTSQGSLGSSSVCALL